MQPEFWWFVARASGMVGAVALALTLIWGLLITTKLIDRRGLPAWLTDLHRYLGGLTVVLIAVHLGALVADSYLTFSWRELFVPFASAWKAGPVAWGVGAFWGIVVVEGTSLARRRMGRTTWRMLHLLSYPVALMVALHSSLAGTDASNPVVRVVSIGLVLVLTALTLFRILHRPTKRSVRPTPNAAATARPTPVPAAPAADQRTFETVPSDPASNQHPVLR